MNLRQANRTPEQAKPDQIHTGEVMSDSTNNADFEAHKVTYSGFVSIVKWAVISMAVVLVALYFIVNP